MSKLDSNIHRTVIMTDVHNPKDVPSLTDVSRKIAGVTKASPNWKEKIAYSQGIMWWEYVRSQNDITWHYTHVCSSDLAHLWSSDVRFLTPTHPIGAVVVPVALSPKLTEHKVILETQLSNLLLPLSIPQMRAHKTIVTILHPTDDKPDLNEILVCQLNYVTTTSDTTSIGKIIEITNNTSFSFLIHPIEQITDLPTQVIAALST